MVIAWWAFYAPANRLDVRQLIASGNGAHLAGDSTARAIKMRNLKLAGLRPACPDLFLMIPRNGYHGCVIEMKRTGWKSPKTEHEKAQENYLMLMVKYSYRAAFAAGAFSAIELIKNYLR